MPWPPHKQTIQDLIELAELEKYFPSFPKDFVPPSLLNPHYVPPSREMWMVTFAITTFVVTSTLFAARITVRVLSRSMGKDDWAIILAFMSYCAFTSTQLLVGVSGIGYHTYDLAIIDITNTFKIIYAHSLLWASTLHLCRISILFLFMRVTEAANSKWVRRYVNFMVWLSICYLLFNVFFLAFECHPLDKSFDLKARLTGACIGFPREMLYFALAAGHIFLDFCVIIPPIPVIHKLSMTKQRKMNLYILLGFGVICCFCASMKMFYAYGKMIRGYDLTWDAIPVALWGQAEATLGIIIACLPALNRVLIRAFPCFSHRKKQDTMQFVMRDEESPRHKPVRMPYDVSDVSTNKSWFAADSHTNSQVGIDEVYVEKSPLVGSNGKRDTTEIKVSKSVSVVSSAYPVLIEIPSSRTNTEPETNKVEHVEDLPPLPRAIYSGPHSGLFTSYAGRASSVFSFTSSSKKSSSERRNSGTAVQLTDKPCLLQQALAKRYGSWGSGDKSERKAKTCVDKSVSDVASYYDMEAERRRYSRKLLANWSQESVVDPHAM